MYPSIFNWLLIVQKNLKYFITVLRSSIALIKNILHDIVWLSM